MSQDDMWSGYTEQSFPGNPVWPCGIPGGVEQEMRGLEPLSLAAIICFALSPPCIPHTLIGVPSVESTVPVRHYRRFLGDAEVFVLTCQEFSCFSYCFSPVHRVSQVIEK